MSEMTVMPTVVWRQVLNDLAFLKQTVATLAKGYKQPDYMTGAEVKESLNIKDDRLKQIRASGQIRYRGKGKGLEYLRKDIDAYKNGDIIIITKKKSQDEEARNTF